MYMKAIYAHTALSLLSEGLLAALDRGVIIFRD